MTAAVSVRSEGNRDTSRLAEAGGAGVLVFTALVVVLHFIDPGLDPVSLTISEYVLGPHGWMLIVAGLAFGLGILALTAAAAAVLPSPRPRVGLALMTLAGLSMVVTGAFPTDPIDPTDPEFVTTAGVIHAVFGILFFTLLAVAALLFTRPVARATGSPWLRWLTFAPLAGYAVFWATGILDHQLGGLFGNSSATGLGERIMAVAFVVWLLAIAVAVRRSADGARSDR